MSVSAARSGEPVRGTNFTGRHRRRLLAFVVLGAVLAGGCGQSPSTAKPKAKVEVFVTNPITDFEVIDSQDFTGRLSAVKTVQVRARVTGYVTEAPFKEGDLVKEGDPLFQIDTRSYAADLKQAKANLKVTEAERNVHERTVERARRLVSGKSMSIEDYELALATLEKDRANVEAMEASRDRSQLFLDWTLVTAPMSGRVSQRQVDPGNLITADTTVLTTIVAEDPVHVYFDVDERTFLDLQKTASLSSGPRPSDPALPVLMRLANEDDYKHVGVVNFLDNQVNGGTGTIRMRGVFPNPRGFLKSGLFARIRLPISGAYKALLIPDDALMSDQGRKYVYVVSKKKNDAGKEEEVVEYRKVKLGQALQGWRVIQDGVKADDRVIVTGMQRVQPQVRVEASAQVAEELPAAPESPLVKLLATRQVAGKKKLADAE